VECSGRNYTKFGEDKQPIIGVLLRFETRAGQYSSVTAWVTGVENRGQIPDFSPLKKIGEGWAKCLNDFFKKV